MLVLSPGRGDVRVPALGHPPARELHIALVEGSLELQQQHRLFDVEDPGHSSITLATPGAFGHDRLVASAAGHGFVTSVWNRLEWAARLPTFGR